ncbi:hypothetical protein [Acrocarpospora pleiomorpha]|uniref:hypothetical protein n=1 Tax=Acrocarpospora pleiomorpha TaxID=90975 RepID=UPI0031DD519B
MFSWLDLPVGDSVRADLLRAVLRSLDLGSRSDLLESDRSASDRVRVVVVVVDVGGGGLRGGGLFAATGSGAGLKGLRGAEGVGIPRRVGGPTVRGTFEVSGELGEAGIGRLGTGGRVSGANLSVNGGSFALPGIRITGGRLAETDFNGWEVNVGVGGLDRPTLV